MYPVCRGVFRPRLPRHGFPRTVGLSSLRDRVRERLTAADGNLVVPSPGSSAVTRAAFFGKVTERSDTLVDAARAAAFPVVCGTALDGVTELRLPIEGSNALIGVFFLESGRYCVEQWFESVDRLGGGDLARYRISVLRDNSFIYRLLKNLFRRGLAKTLSEKDQAAALYITEPFYEQMEALGIENVSTGYLFLVDSKGRIRWSATGVPSGDQEVQGFLKALEKLC